MKSIRHALLLVLLSCLVLGSVSAYDPPAGGDGMPFLLSPAAAGGGLSIASGLGPSAAAVNPAVLAALQQVTLDAGYMALVGFGTETGFGSLVNLGLALPQAYGVWNFNLNVQHVPASFVSMPLGTIFNLQVGIAKDLFPDLYVGAAVGGGVGNNGAWDWALGLNLGFVHHLGDLGFISELRWAGTLRNIGKSFQPVAINGFAGTPATAYESPFTPAFGIAGTLLNHEASGIRVGTNLDLLFPTFQNVVFNAGLDLSWRQLVTLRAGWDINLRETLAGSGRSLIPSFSLAARIQLNSAADDSFISERGWNRSELQPVLTARPLYNDVWAIGGGVTLPLGIVDRDPPVITLGYPQTPWELYYMSPNNDGVQDELALPLSIVDQRYIQSFVLNIYDNSGTLVRSIANKESRPESTNWSGLWSRLTYVRHGVDVPPELIWNGLSDTGSVVADGIYHYELLASDDNGNEAVTERLSVVVDNTAPALSLERPIAANALIFSPDGDGNKDNLALIQTGSEEDLWLAEFLDVAGTVLRAYEFRNVAPQRLDWDGADNAGVVVADGVYSYRIGATDRAGNRSADSLENILINTQQPPVSISIDRAAFSPNGDGEKDELTITTSVPVRTGIIQWTLSVLDGDNQARWTTTDSAGATLPVRSAFTGRDNAGQVLPEGSYRARLSVRYLNGHSPESLSAGFLLDITAPVAQVQADRVAFNPLAETSNRLTVFNNNATAEDRWLGEIVSQTSSLPVRNYSFSGQPDASVVWDGADEAGRVASDGAYFWRLSAIDRAGNAFSVDSAPVRIDTGNKTVRLAVDMRAFSPNNDRVKDTLTFLPETAAGSTIVAWSLAILDAERQTIRRFTGNNAPPRTVPWDGKSQSGSPAADGAYSAALEVRYDTGETETAASFEVTLDTVAPALELSIDYLLFSPNGSGRKDTVTIAQVSPVGDNWEAGMQNAAGETVRTWSWRNRAETFAWDGSDQNGNRLPDGAYRYTIHSEDAAGNRAERQLTGITIDARVPQAFVTIAAPGFSPTGVATSATIGIGLVTTIRDGIESWRLTILDENGISRKIFRGNPGQSVPAELTWDGKADDGSVTQGNYTASLLVDYLKGDRVEVVSGAFALDNEGPRVAVRMTPEYFSPDNDGIDDELRFTLSVSDLSLIESWRLEVIEGA
ncbi:MAG TPA: hypothetical protein DCX65_01945, partial [Spirochaetaceae bacterium]|nr:hypothetical protein [Spirochaetaceae bacterium]